MVTSRLVICGCGLGLKLIARPQPQILKIAKTARPQPQITTTQKPRPQISKTTHRSRRYFISEMEDNDTIPFES